MSTPLFIAKTVQSSSFKNLIEDVKDIIQDANFIIDTNGVRLTAMDESKIVLVRLYLEADKFEQYSCGRRQTIGVNMPNLFKLIKVMTNDDTLTLFMSDDEPNLLGIKIENAVKNKITTFRLKLLDLDDEELVIQSTATFGSIITMPSVDFQKLCRDMHYIGDIIEIRSIGQQLILKCSGDFASQETVIGQNSQGLSLKNESSDVIVQGLFHLKHLVSFTKCTNLSPQCSLYLKNDFPLIIQYEIANLGNIRLLLAPYNMQDGNKMMIK